MKQEILKDLNPEQKEAVVFEQGPLLIVAGAGTGKTTVITRRIAHLILNEKAKPEEILAVTFTDKAAEEMETRVDQLLPYGYADLWISTFHAFCERVLRDNAIEMGLSDDFKLLSQTGQALLLRENFKRFDLCYYKPLGNPNKFIQALIKHFSRAKDEVISPEEYLAYVKNKKLNLDNKQSDELLNAEVRRLEEIANAYHTYQQILLENNALDFGDLINYALKLFKERPLVLEKFRKQFKYILVDEFQDTNYAQYELIRLLALPHNNLTVCADDDQCLPADTMIATPEGDKKIQKIKQGDEVITGVGKGRVSISKTNKVFLAKKTASFLTFKTQKGFKIETTDNHKMFCFVPRVKTKGKKFYYVYLMYRQDLGWRIGKSDNLAIRLKLERSADKIIGLKAFNSEEEAKYYELLFSLKYSIPTICFKERNGLIIKGEWQKKLYQELDVEEGVKKIADDFNIDLNSHHYCLDGVTRGDKVRIKINLTLCHRKYASKTEKTKLLKNPMVLHQLSLETSDSFIISKLTKAGFQLRKTRKGRLIRIESKDIKELGKVALRLQEITGGIIENRCSIGKTNIASQPAVIMPAKNVLLGHYLPIFTKRGIIYDQIISIKKCEKKAKVYDLEINKTHNFIANGVVVHNSIYKFRGASVSNVLQFKKDFPQAKEVVIKRNYRSSQKILDLSYQFIQLNNPNRLEIQLAGKVTKKLDAQKKTKGIIEYIHCEMQEEEVRKVIEKILELKNLPREIIRHGGGFPHGGISQGKSREVSVDKPIKEVLPEELKASSPVTWSDFAILIRANNQADIFSQILDRAGIPYQFLASRGLYNKAVIMDVLAYLRLLDSYHENSAMYRILNSPIIKISHEEISLLNYWANRKNWSLYEALKRAPTLKELTPESLKEIEKLMSLIARHTQLTKEKKLTQIIFAFLEDTGYLKIISQKKDLESLENINFLNQFLRKVEEYERTEKTPSLRDFRESLDLAMEMGDEGGLQKNVEDTGPESVKIMTVHSAKGLEFRYVFIVNLVDRKFPTTERKEVIELPDDLVKEIAPSGDIHLQEERRLFYVAMTRAKEGLFFTAADDYGGVRKKKASRFLQELGFEEEEKKSVETIDLAEKFKVSEKKSYSFHFVLPKRFSFTQLKAFETCPLQYKFAHILRVPTKGRFVFSFGKSMHNTLFKFFQSLLSKGVQQELIPSSAKATEGKPSLPTLKELLEIYDKSWIDDWYDDKKHQEDYKNKGREILKKLHRSLEEKLPKPRFLEIPFSFKLDNYILKGAMDRVDEAGDNQLEIIDYKTGSLPKADLTLENKEQLLIYQLAGQEIFREKVEKLTFYYLEENKALSFLGTEGELKKIKDKVINIIEEIQRSDFSAEPNMHTCKFCDFKEICEYRDI